MNVIKKIIEYGLYLLVFILPWQTRLILRTGEINGGYFEYGTISLYVIDLLIISLVLLFAFQKIKELKNRSEKNVINKVWYILAVLELIIFVSIFFSLDKWLAFYGYLRFLLGVGIFFLISSANYKKIILYYSFIAGIFLQSCFAIWQFLFQASFANKWLGLAFHDSKALGTSVVETLNGERWLRAYGSFDHPNILGGYLCFGLLLLILLKIKHSKNKVFGLRITNYELRISNMICYYFVLLIIFLALFFTFSRAAWLAFVVGIIYVLFFSIYKKDYFSQKIILKFILFFGIIFSILFNQYSFLVTTRLSDSTRLEQKSNNERIESLSVARKIIKNNFLFGTGIANYELAVQSEILPDEENWFYQPVHNLYLLIFSEIGVFGGLCIIIFFGYYLYEFFKKRGGNEGVFATLLLSLLVIGLFDHWLWSLHAGILVFWLILGIISRNIKK